MSSLPKKLYTGAYATDRHIKATKNVAKWEKKVASNKEFINNKNKIAEYRAKNVEKYCNSVRAQLGDNYKETEQYKVLLSAINSDVGRSIIELLKAERSLASLPEQHQKKIAQNLKDEAKLAQAREYLGFTQQCIDKDPKAQEWLERYDAENAGSSDDDGMDEDE